MFKDGSLYVEMALLKDKSDDVIASSPPSIEPLPVSGRRFQKHRPPPYLPQQHSRGTLQVTQLVWKEDKYLKLFNRRTTQPARRIGRPDDAERIPQWAPGWTRHGVIVLWILACSHRTSETRPKPTASSSPDVEWSGCSGIRKGPICEVGPEEKLTVWVRGPRSSRSRFVTDRGPAVVSSELQMDGGTRLGLQLPPHSRRIALEKENDSATEWWLELGEPSNNSEIDRLVKLGRSGKYEEALRDLGGLRARVSARDQGLADAAMGRMLLALGQVDRAKSSFRASMTAAKEQGRIADVIQDGSALVWALAQLQQRYGEARAVLKEMTPFGELYPEGRVWLDYHAGLLAVDTADVRTALARYRAAESRARRLGQLQLADESAMEVARILIRIGRAEEAVQILKSLPLPADSCARATRALNLVLALSRPVAHLSPNRGGDDELTEALASAQASTAICPDPNRRLMAIVYALEEALQRPPDAKALAIALRLEATTSNDSLLHSSHRAETLGRWYLKQKRPAVALVAFESELPRARAAGLVDEVFRAELGTGRALLALGRRTAGIERLREAQKLLEGMMGGIPLAEGRGTFLNARDEGVRNLVTALVDGGAKREALRVARWSRAFELSSAVHLNKLAHLSPEGRLRWDLGLESYQETRAQLEHLAESDWTLSRADRVRSQGERQRRAEQARAALDDAYRALLDDLGGGKPNLPAPSPGELYLAFFPGADGWFAFAETSSHIVVRRIDDSAFSSVGAASEILQIFGRELQAARRIRLLPYGKADRVDWQLVPWKGRPLIEAREVVYGLDTGGSQGPGEEGSRDWTALVVSNPTGDLPASTREADEVSRSLADWRVTRLDGSGATRTAMLASLPSVALLHFAGHAVISELGGIDSALILNDGARVEMGDLLAAPSVPEVVVLSACEAAGTGGIVPSLMGLAQAFVASGSRAAIAPTRQVADREAEIFSSALYASLVASRTETAPGEASQTVLRRSLPAAFRAATVAVLSRRDQSGSKELNTEDFRLWVP
jgi:tetratricopeptide (TPR) repeat protein